MNWSLKRNRTQWNDALAGTSWQDFERILARYFQQQGYAVEHVGTAETTARFDGGVDLVLRRDGETTLVQCKHWNASQVPHNEVHQLLGLLETRGAQHAILVTSGEFTRAARDAASRSLRISLMDGAELRQRVDPRLIPPPAVPASGPDNTLDAWAPVAEKALDAFLSVKFGRRYRRGQRDFDSELKFLVFRGLLGVLLVLAAFLFIRHQLGTWGEQARRLAPPRPPAPVVVAPGQPGARPARTAQPVVVVPQPPPMTPEQLKEWERKNAESMKILEETTPSVYD